MYERRILLGLIRVHILHHASEKNGIYGVGIIGELSRHGYKISPGTLYPILHEMKQNKMLKIQKSKVNGKIRKIYKTTKEGNRTLERLKQFVIELFQEVI